MEYISIIVNAVVSIISVFGGILTANRLTNYRIEQLEKRVDKHNNVIDRTYRLEQECAVLKNRESVSEHRISDLEEKE